MRPSCRWLSLWLPAALSTGWLLPLQHACSQSQLPLFRLSLFLFDLSFLLCNRRSFSALALVTYTNNKVQKKEPAVRGAGDGPSSHVSSWETHRGSLSCEVQSELLDALEL